MLGPIDDPIEAVVTEALSQAVKRQAEEIERLRLDYELLSDDYKQLLGDVERLRGLLREGLEHHDEYNWQKRVRKALGDDR